MLSSAFARCHKHQLGNMAGSKSLLCDFYTPCSRKVSFEWLVRLQRSMLGSDSEKPFSTSNIRHAGISHSYREGHWMLGASIQISLRYAFRVPVLECARMWVGAYLHMPPSTCTRNTMWHCRFVKVRLTFDRAAAATRAHPSNGSRRTAYAAARSWCGCRDACSWHTLMSAVFVSFCRHNFPTIDISLSLSNITQAFRLRLLAFCTMHIEWQIWAAARRWRRRVSE